LKSRAVIKERANDLEEDMKKSPWTSLCALAGSIITASLAQAAGDMPRYSFKIGQELVYQSSSDFHSAHQSIKQTETATFWVTRQNRDGSWHLVVLRKQTEPGRSDETRKLNSFDISAGGQVAGKPGAVENEPLSAPFFTLPSHVAQAQQGWEVSQNEAMQTAYRLKSAPSDPAGQWIFEATGKGIFQDIYLGTSTNTIYFDGARGLIQKIVSVDHQGFGFVGDGKGVAQLKSAAAKDPGWMTQLAWECDVCAKAKAGVRAALESLQTGMNESAAKAAAKAALQTAQNRVKLPVIREEIQSQLLQLDSSFKYAAEDEGKSDALLNKAAASWATTDLDGHKHALEDYRGTVVALDFWYRGCGWCMRAMPQIKALAEQFRGRPVVILGMNTDPDDKDARFVVDKLQLNYLTLKAAGLPEKYGVQGFPTFLVIDQQGIVRARHVGYSPTLREEMGRAIENLLQEGTDGGRNKAGAIKPSSQQAH
jgi:thiol-disulfide isomerase/thioredoxin